uniref:Nitronate monooxygenase domain-containing protein n=1 Tax=Aplanochytrium stocchinoi TaxID=215587 RepID=A0A7S3PNT6_9STRA|mmetsp:Transcript_21143/g.25727  ORF Transcript_21143/g.25727 Transcript_21143/m.25727 type:complete len:329 (+) Transcript_21143:63-1049(+)|eukprot:CAMPEP_0204834702 /NCGR_PEP_ID=MMETSP1346-20131115/20501_1 /ASSEMBLY_ACC=CAM_ASM_000771 /TAXON_ID=215587 /ORGANISM="Aplanochytrium stocchinoi, Strain GSBS06" /LENGTH=328 /DNA_ID=CAMNT_0051968165 /DNA_START=116 /DNA_END=1102 /DNA_ORIENTATION=-
MLRTLLTERLKIKHPIIQGGMHYVGYAPLAAAVSNAGGLGIITALTQPSPEDLRDEIQKCKRLTDKPFGVNLTLLPMLTPPDYPAYAQVVVDEGIKVVETAGHYKGLEPFVELFKKHDTMIIHKCVAVRHALTAQRMGVDMISMDGFECAGHPGEMDIGNWVLLAKAARKLDIPFVASGGCADGKQLAAALSLGAEGINMGTRFMATVEAPIHDNIKQAIVDADENSTALVMRSMRNTERVYKNKAVEKVMEIEREHPGEFDKIRHLISGQNYRKVFQESGDVDEGVWSAGVVMGLIDDIPTCESLLDSIVKEAHDIITGRLQNMIVK